MIEKKEKGEGYLHCFFQKVSALKIKGYIAIMSGDL
jgi:hypothetical protein